jgi:WXG100 family type VII secretion target
MPQIRMNYDDMAASSKSFAEMSSRAAELVQNVRAEADRLSAGWEGVADVEFLSQIDSCMQRLAHTPLMMSEISTAIKTASDLIQQAEQQAQAAIQSTIVDDTN